MILPKRKVLEIRHKLIQAIRTRLFIANESHHDLEVVPVEVIDGSKPRILIRIVGDVELIRAKLRKPRRYKQNCSLPEADDYKP